MKIDISQRLENADGTPALNGKEPVTLKDILIGALLSPAEEGDKIKHYNLYRDLRKTKVGFVSWSAEDIAVVKKAVTRTQPTLVMGQAHEMLEREYVPVIPETHYEIVEGVPVFVAEAP